MPDFVSHPFDILTAYKITPVTDPDFIEYVGIPDLHDGIVLRVSVQGKTPGCSCTRYLGCEAHHRSGNSFLLRTRKIIPAF
jgi:hypothetical protein